MKAAEIVKLTLDIVQTYYENDLSLFFAYMDEDALWYGPAKGQFLSGRQAILNAWSREVNPLTLTLGSIRADAAAIQPACCEVMLSFPVTTHYPSGESIPVDQIIHMSWCERKVAGFARKQPRMRVIHISNLYRQLDADRIYPVHFDQVYQGYVSIAPTGRRLRFHGADRADYYLSSDAIHWIESAAGSRHAIVHTGEKTIEVTISVQAIEAAYPDLFLRCHSCYLVNPLHIAAVKRFKAVMTDGAELPIPEKRYTAFRDRLAARSAGAAD